MYCVEILVLMCVTVYVYCIDRYFCICPGVEFFLFCSSKTGIFSVKLN